MLKLALELFRTKGGFYSALVAVVDQDGRVRGYCIVDVADAGGRLSGAFPAGEYVEVVVVVAGDGEVPHPPVMDGRGRSADDYSALAVRGLEMIAWFELFRRNPMVVQ